MWTLVGTAQPHPPCTPLGHVWHVMLVWKKGNIEKSLCVTVLCTIIMVHNGTSSSYRLVDCIELWILLGIALLSSKHLCVFCLYDAIYILKIFLLAVHPSLYLLVSWTWWDWPLTWLTNHRPSVLWHCWLGHVTRKTVSEMTYYVSSGTLNSTIPYRSIDCIGLWSCLV